MGFPPLGKQIVEDAAFCSSLLARLTIVDTEENKAIYMRLAVSIELMGKAAARRLQLNEAEQLRRNGDMHASLLPFPSPRRDV